MIGDEARGYVFVTSKIMYHVALFASFFGAIQVQPWLLTQVQKYITQYVWSHQILAWIGVYLLAIYIFPAIAFSIIKAVMDK